MGGTAGDGGAPRAPAEPGAPHTARFALPKFRPTTLPTTLLTRSALLGRLEAGASQRLTVVVGSAGAGKSVLLGAIRRVDLCTSTPGLKFVTLGFGFSKAVNFIRSAS